MFSLNAATPTHEASTTPATSSVTSGRLMTLSTPVRSRRWKRRISCDSYLYPLQEHRSELPRSVRDREDLDPSRSRPVQNQEVTESRDRPRANALKSRAAK